LLIYHVGSQAAFWIWKSDRRKSALFALLFAIYPNKIHSYSKLQDQSHSAPKCFVQSSCVSGRGRDCVSRKRDAKRPCHNVPATTLVSDFVFQQFNSQAWGLDSILKYDTIVILDLFQVQYHVRQNYWQVYRLPRCAHQMSMTESFRRLHLVTCSDHLTIYNAATTIHSSSDQYHHIASNTGAIAWITNWKWATNTTNSRLLIARLGSEWFHSFTPHQLSSMERLGLLYLFPPSQTSSMHSCDRTSCTSHPEMYSTDISVTYLPSSQRLRTTISSSQTTISKPPIPLLPQLSLTNHIH